MNGSDLAKALENAFPKSLAYEWDNVGVMVGTLNRPITKVLVTLDVTKDALNEAKAMGAELIIAHHPLIFGGLNAIHYDAYKGQLIRDIIKADITVFAAHTNYDLATGGMNDMLAEKLNLQNVAILEYEDAIHGIGRIGDLKTPLPLMDAIDFIKKALDISSARYIGNDRTKPIKSIAISGGSGADHAASAKKKGADLYITGDVTYHKAHDMIQMGQRALDVGHSAEKHFKHALKRWLESTFESLEVSVFEDAQNPFKDV